MRLDVGMRSSLRSRRHLRSLSPKLLLLLWLSGSVEGLYELRIDAVKSSVELDAMVRLSSSSVWTSVAARRQVSLVPRSPRSTTVQELRNQMLTAQRIEGYRPKRGLRAKYWGLAQARQWTFRRVPHLESCSSMLKEAKHQSCSTMRGERRTYLACVRPPSPPNKFIGTKTHCEKKEHQLGSASSQSERTNLGVGSTSHVLERLELTDLDSGGRREDVGGLTHELGGVDCKGGSLA